MSFETCRHCDCEDDCEEEGRCLDRAEFGDSYDIDFANPGGHSSLRAASRHNPRNLPCPTCHEPNVLTPADRAAGYQCNACADRAEGGGY